MAPRAVAAVVSAVTASSSSLSISPSSSVRYEDEILPNKHLSFVFDCFFYLAGHKFSLKVPPRPHHRQDHQLDICEREVSRTTTANLHQSKSQEIET